MLAARANRFARWALDQGLAKGDTVCLMMPNRPEYMAIWLGLCSVGVTAALINTQLRGRSLAHCLDIATAKHAIVAAEFGAELRTAAAQMENPPQIWVHGDDGNQYERIDRAVERFSGEPLTPAERRATTITDRALLIYTSGTTGLPKAANVSHRRLLQWSFWFAGLMNTGPGDRMYDCLPMYHSVGGVVATGAVLVRGGSVLIRDKFSARRFWDDIADWDCTLFQYIGELARYLLNAPQAPRERTHRLRLCCGNGLRADVWEKFQKRFAIPRIIEFYAATEGNVSLYNVEGKVGAVGRVPPFLASRFPLALVKFDAAAGEPARGAGGFCIRCETNETGEAIGRILRTPRNPAACSKVTPSARTPSKRSFATYSSRATPGFAPAISCAWTKPDFFISSTGSAIRSAGRARTWPRPRSPRPLRHSPVSRTRPSTAFAYRAAKAPPAWRRSSRRGALDLAKLHKHLAQRLPDYARPRFLRIAGKLPATSTFKHSKTELQRDGFDPATTNDPIYFDDAAGNSFVPLDSALYARITAGKVRL